MKLTAIQTFIITCFFFLLGCGEAGKGIKNEFMQTARGETGEIILVMDSTQYEGIVGQTLLSILREPMKGLPQDEPLFNVNKVNPRRLNNVLKSATNMIFVMTLDSKTGESNVLRSYFTDQSLKTIQRDTSVFLTTRKDEFAKGQIVLYLFSSSEEILVEKLKQNKDRILEYFEQQERARIKSRILKKREMAHEQVIAERHPFTLEVPYGWDIAKNEENFLWMRFLESNREHNLFFYYEPYRDAAIFEDIPAFRDKITTKYLVDAEKPQIYVMRQEREDIIGINIDPFNFNGRYAVRSRGLWKISDNTGGGPFISYAIVDEPQQMVYYIEGYVYAPSSKKKNFIRELDAILSTFNTTSK